MHTMKLFFRVLFTEPAITVFELEMSIVAITIVDRYERIGWSMGVIVALSACLRLFSAYASRMKEQP